MVIPVLISAQLSMHPNGKSPASMEFKEGKQVNIASFFESYRKDYPLSSENQLEVMKVSTDKTSSYHRYNPYYKGIEIIGAQYILYEKNNAVWYANGQLVHDLDLDVRPILSEQEALNKALLEIDAKTYVWEKAENVSFIKKSKGDKNATYYPLSTLKPGNGYLANFKNPVSVSFNDYNLWPVDSKVQPLQSPADGLWNLARTGEVHLISVATSALQALKNYTHIGAFDTEGNCIGFCEIINSNQNALLTVYGDDTYTSYNDSAESGEYISFRAYDPATRTETELEATYNQNFANADGLYATGGLSAITGFKAGATGIGEDDNLVDVRIYPNPAKDMVSIALTGFNPARAGLSGLDTGQSGFVATLLSSDGRLMKTISINTKTTRVSVGDLLPGIYILKIESNENTVFKRVVIQ